MKYRTLRFQRRAAIGVIQLDRPAKRNALSDAMIDELDSCIGAVPDGVKALVLHGAVVGGGASVRVPRLIGAARMADMMLTGRVYSADEGQANGISTYLVPAGKGLAKGIELAKRIAENAPATNFALMHALPRIAELGRDAGLLMESMMAGIAQSEPEAKRRMKDFLDKRGAKVKRRG